MADFDFDKFIKAEGITVKDKLTEDEKQAIAKGITEKELKGNKALRTWELEALKVKIQDAIKAAEEALVKKPTEPKTRGKTAPVGGVSKFYSDLNGTYRHGKKGRNPFPGLHAKYLKENPNTSNDDFEAYIKENASTLFPAK